MKRHSGYGLRLLELVCVSPFCFGQKTVCVIRWQKWTAVAEAKSFDFLYEGVPISISELTVLSRETDAQGKVEFELPPPAPLRFSVGVQLTSEHWRCECMALVTTKNLMDTGVDGPGPVHRSTGAGDGPMWVLGRRIGLEIWHGVP